jgi:hypothetical protein
MHATRTRSEFNMRVPTRILLYATALVLTARISGTVQADTASEREYQLKAAFLYNFIMFIDSPRFAPPSDDAGKNASDARKPILIGILGDDPFGAAFEPLQSKEVRDRPVVIKRFKGLETPVDTEAPATQNLLDAIKQCHVLFVCASEREHLPVILRPITGEDILTVADVPGFLEAGGTINFIIEDKKVRFEINMAAAGRAKLEIRSKLLRLAKRIIKTDMFERQSDGGNETGNGDR